ncbi:Teichoic-acid-transporting ATPase [Stanieria cyanosphaera PCC 7437]|uniref:Teichoic-acid-transporting ATPase n=1 Tax=Stanieria cyanosphaera (strain ATCC 29371 / PCC 7437) TaxID=111780 RepID=K9XWU7_STAC7|nr:polysaccharide ABC transporter ATP-binding protein [Stanieria cyanosphaera]AFZ36132.1 Teichoic-acid-transporting ATPase [Stanieria cyanosphaera PCC 7437]
MTISISEKQELPPSKDNEVVLSIEGVSKKFCRSLKHSLFYGIQDITTDLVGLRNNERDLRNQEFWALDNVSFELRRGEALGLVGKNGSGKSTLLRIIAGLIKPDRGQVRVRGTVAPLIALGAGFNPILTGRENIYANMSILGLSKQEIDERFDEVVEFAEIGDAIDAPVQSYSSGMAARLGFASAIHTEPDILLIDEVLAVGDIKFQSKCHRKLSELRQQGTSFILVSHNSQIVLGVCDIAVYLFQGQQLKFGDIYSVISQYERHIFASNYEQTLGVLKRPAKQATESNGLDITSLYFKNSQGQQISSPVSGEPVDLIIGCQVNKKLNNIITRINFYDTKFGTSPIQFLSNYNDKQQLTLTEGQHEIVVRMPYFCFKPGLYDLKIVIRNDALFTLDYVESFRFQVDSNGSMTNCEFYQPRLWQIISY